jgi:hypothetical protein
MPTFNTFSYFSSSNRTLKKTVARQPCCKFTFHKNIALKMSIVFLHTLLYTNLYVITYGASVSLSSYVRESTTWLSWLQKTGKYRCVVLCTVKTFMIIFAKITHCFKIYGGRTIDTHIQATCWSQKIACTCFWEETGLEATCWCVGCTRN